MAKPRTALSGAGAAVVLRGNTSHGDSHTSSDDEFSSGDDIPGTESQAFVYKTRSRRARADKANQPTLRPARSARPLVISDSGKRCDVAARPPSWPRRRHEDFSMPPWTIKNAQQLQTSDAPGPNGIKRKRRHSRPDPEPETEVPAVSVKEKGAVMASNADTRTSPGHDVEPRPYKKVRIHEEVGGFDVESLDERSVPDDIINNINAITDANASRAHAGLGVDMEEGPQNERLGNGSDDEVDETGAGELSVTDTKAEHQGRSLGGYYQYEPNPGTPLITNTSQEAIAISSASESGSDMDYDGVARDTIEHMSPARSSAQPVKGIVDARRADMNDEDESTAHNGGGDDVEARPCSSSALPPNEQPSQVDPQLVEEACEEASLEQTQSSPELPAWWWKFDESQSSAAPQSSPTDNPPNPPTPPPPPSTSCPAPNIMASTFLGSQPFAPAQHSRHHLTDILPGSISLPPQKPALFHTNAAVLHPLPTGAPQAASSSPATSPQIPMTQDLDTSASAAMSSSSDVNNPKHEIIPESSQPHISPETDVSGPRRPMTANKEVDRDYEPQVDHEREQGGMDGPASFNKPAIMNSQEERNDLVTTEEAMSGRCPRRRSQVDILAPISLIPDDSLAKTETAPSPKQRGENHRVTEPTARLGAENLRRLDVLMGTRGWTHEKEDWQFKIQYIIESNVASTHLVYAPIKRLWECSGYLLVLVNPSITALQPDKTRAGIKKVLRRVDMIVNALCSTIDPNEADTDANTDTDDDPKQCMNGLYRLCIPALVLVLLKIFASGATVSMRPIQHRITLAHLDAMHKISRSISRLGGVLEAGTARWYPPGHIPKKTIESRKLLSKFIGYLCEDVDGCLNARPEVFAKRVAITEESAPVASKQTAENIEEQVRTKTTPGPEVGEGSSDGNYEIGSDGSGEESDERVSNESDTDPKAKGKLKPRGGASREELQHDYRQPRQAAWERQRAETDGGLVRVAMEKQVPKDETIRSGAPAALSQTPTATTGEYRKWEQDDDRPVVEALRSGNGVISNPTEIARLAGRTSREVLERGEKIKDLIYKLRCQNGKKIPEWAMPKSTTRKDASRTNGR